MEHTHTLLVTYPDILYRHRQVPYRLMVPVYQKLFHLRPSKNRPHHQEYPAQSNTVLLVLLW